MPPGPGGDLHTVPATARAAHAVGVVGTPAVRHSIAPEYVRWQTDRSRAELGRPRLDAVFLHNPEHGHQDHCQPLADRLRAAFAVLEEDAHAGQLAAYGVATWSGFTGNALTVARLQLPVSLVMDAHLSEALNGRGPITQAADRGWDVHASAPLHGGELLSLATPEVTALVKEGAGTAAACLAAAASCPGVTRVLLATGNPAHCDDALTVTGAPAIPPQTLRTALDVLATCD
ncbi:aldo-keto reductase family protein [Streptomyces mirabilis]|uniref:hypothetical protein n=1 Tax=Streptomyces mirabilis TaxID=68239 RepID=UPI0036AA1FF7